MILAGLTLSISWIAWSLWLLQRARPKSVKKNYGKLQDSSGFCAVIFADMGTKNKLAQNQAAACNLKIQVV